MAVWILLLSALSRLSTVWAVSTSQVYFITDGMWNMYCNDSAYASLQSPVASVTLSPSDPSQDHRLYGSCLLHFHNSETNGKLHITFIKYPAFHQCSNARLAVYEIIDGIHSLLWEGVCGDAPHIWKSRILVSQTTDVWIWYEKELEWPAALPYSPIDVQLLITTKPIPPACDGGMCSHRGSCAVLNSDPPRDLTHFEEDRSIWKCHCMQPYSGVSCSDIDFPENACTPGLCLNAGQCVIDSSSSGYYCDCPMPYSGDHCQYNSAMCEGNDICGENGECKVQERSVVCSCKPGWIGSRCTVADPCLSTPCLNSGTCVSVSMTSYRCLCADGWTGDMCSTVWLTSDNSTAGALTGRQVPLSGTLVAVIVVLCVITFLALFMFLMIYYENRTSKRLKERDDVISFSSTNKSLSNRSHRGWTCSMKADSTGGDGHDHMVTIKPDADQVKTPIKASMEKHTEIIREATSNQPQGSYAFSVTENMTNEDQQFQGVSTSKPPKPEFGIPQRADIHKHRKDVATRLRKGKLRHSILPPPINIITPSKEKTNSKVESKSATESDSMSSEGIKNGSMDENETAEKEQTAIVSAASRRSPTPSQLSNHLETTSSTVSISVSDQHSSNRKSSVSISTNSQQSYHKKNPSELKEMQRYRESINQRISQLLSPKSQSQQGLVLSYNHETVKNLPSTQASSTVASITSLSSSKRHDSRISSINHNSHSHITPSRDNSNTFIASESHNSNSHISSSSRRSRSNSIANSSLPDTQTIS